MQYCAIKFKKAETNTVSLTAGRRQPVFAQRYTMFLELGDMSSPSTGKSRSQIAIVGVGKVGAAVAHALVLGSAASELLLVDVKVDFRDGQVRDLSDAAYCANSATRVRAATYHEAAQCDIVVITAGSKYSVGKRSNDLAELSRPFVSAADTTPARWLPYRGN